MAKKNVELKQETLRRIRAIIEECGGVKKIKPNQLRNNKHYLSLQKSFMNGFERRIVDEVIGYIYDGKTDDEIQLIYKELRDQIIDEMSDEKSAKIVDEMEQATEAMFIKSKNKVVDGPIIIDTTCNGDDEEDTTRGLFGKFVSSTVEAGLNDAVNNVEETVNEVTKIAKEKIDEVIGEGENNSGMLILSKGAIVGSDGKSEKISTETLTDEQENYIENNVVLPVSIDGLDHSSFDMGQFISDGVCNSMRIIFRPFIDDGIKDSTKVTA